MKKTITTLAILAIATGAYGATTYRSISITPEAKLKVVNMSKELKMTQRDTASKIIMEWGEPKNNIVHALQMIFQNDASGTEQKMLNICNLLNS